MKKQTAPAQPAPAPIKEGQSPAQGGKNILRSGEVAKLTR